MDSKDIPPPPTYKIFRDQHGIPQFSPKRGSQALTDALIYAFPTLSTELQLMQAALRKFFDSERGSKIIFELPENDLQTSLAKRKDPIPSPSTEKPLLRNWKVELEYRPRSRTSSRASSRATSRMGSRPESPAFGLGMDALEGGGTMTTWSLASGMELERRRRPYDPVKRRKVAENRGNACEKHRASKTTCDPYSCPQNKLYSKMAQGARRDSCSSVGVAQSTSVATPSTKEMSFKTTDPEMGTQLPPPGADVFWDGVDGYMKLHSKDSFMSFDCPSLTDSSSTPWTGSPYTGQLSWSTPTLVSEPGDGVPLTQTTMPGLEIEQYSLDGTKSLVHTNNSAQNSLQQSTDNQNAIDPNLMDISLGDIPDESSEWPSLGDLDEPFMPNDDPFMGCPNKRTSQLVDDYSWMVSHVESL